MTSDGQDRPRPLASETVDALARSAYPTGNVIRRALLTLRDEGLRSFWFKLLGECGYRRLLLLERALDQPIADYTPGDRRAPALGRHVLRRATPRADRRRGMGRGAAGLGAVSRMPDRCDAG